MRCCCYIAATYGGYRDLQSGLSHRLTWWARQGSNLRPPACKAGALPLSYAPCPGPVGRAGFGHAGNAARACFQTPWSRASPGSFISAKRTIPSVSTRNVPRFAVPAASLNTP